MFADVALLHVRAVHAFVSVHEPLSLSTMYSHVASPLVASLSAMLMSNAAFCHELAAGLVNVTVGAV